MTDRNKPRIDPRKIRTRLLLKDAFIDLLQEMDIGKISVNRIAERSGINRVTFYLHYHDISDMMEKMADDMEEDIRNVLNQLPVDSNQSLSDFDMVNLVNLLEHIAANAKFYKTILSSKQTSIFTERLLKILTEMIASRIEQRASASNRIISTSGAPKDIAIWYGSAALIGTIVQWLRNDIPYTPLFLAQNFSALTRRNYMVQDNNLAFPVAET